MRADGTAWDPRARPASIVRARDRCQRQGDCIRVRLKGLLAPAHRHQRVGPGGQPGRAGHRHPAKGTQIFGVPAESYGFENKLLAWETIAPLVENCSPLRYRAYARSGRARDPLRSRAVHRRAGRRGGRRSGRFPPQVPRRSAPCRRRQGGGGEAGWEARTSPQRERGGELLKGRGIAFAERNGTASPPWRVEVERSTGRVWARRVVVAHDCGL